MDEKLKNIFGVNKTKWFIDKCRDKIQNKSIN